MNQQLEPVASWNCSESLLDLSSEESATVLKHAEEVTACTTYILILFVLMSRSCFMMKVRSQLEEKKALKSPNSNIEYRSVEKWSCAYALDKNELYPGCYKYNTRLEHESTARTSCITCWIWHRRSLLLFQCMPEEVTDYSFWFFFDLMSRWLYNISTISTRKNGVFYGNKYSQTVPNGWVLGHRYV